MDAFLPHRLVPRALRAIVALAGACLAAGIAQAQSVEDPPGRVGRVAAVDGDVRTVTSDGSWVSVAANRPLSTGDRITTDHAGHATLEFGSSSFRLGPDSDVTVEYLVDHCWTVGSEETVLNKLGELHRMAGGFGVLAVNNFDHLDHRQAWRDSVERLQKNVLPKLP